MLSGVASKILDNRVILVDKPEGITSFEVIRKIKRLSGLKKIGHSGTLDKFASGLLVVCTGKATKLTRIFLESDKRYYGEIQLGVSTDTIDIYGRIINKRPAENITREILKGVIKGFSGKISQVPPEYSSLKVKGRRASDLVRHGKSVELKERIVEVYDIDLLNYDKDKSIVSIDLRCSKGTYVRSIARDMGEILGCGAFLKKLRRIESGSFNVKDAGTLNEIEDFVLGELKDGKFAMTPENALNDFSKITVCNDFRNKILNGVYFSRESVLAIDESNKKPYIILDEDKNLIAIADIRLDKWKINYLNIFNMQNY